VEKIKDDRAPFYRPPLPIQESAGMHSDILTVMKQCWAEEPSNRPSFGEIAKVLRTINRGKLVLFAIKHLKTLRIVKLCTSLKQPA